MPSPAHPYAVAMETAMLAPNAEVSIFPWKEPKDNSSWTGSWSPGAMFRNAASLSGSQSDMVC